MTIADLAWLILVLPLLAAAGITLFTLRDGPRSGRLSISAAVLAFLFSLVLFGVYHAGGPVHSSPWVWLDFQPALDLQFTLVLDRLSLLMLVVVTGVAGAIHIYSYGYMGEDPGMARYFAGLSLFLFAMIGIVLAGNFVMLFIFWELVGLSSYLLIGFWYERPAAADAAKKAFLTNRLGDFGFLLGILLIWGLLGTVQFDELKTILVENPGALGVFSGVAGLLIFCGAMGKSAQFPLHVWLPDAMEGPTPVSALIHAATMVAAGVYMLCRVFFLYQATPAWPEVLAWLGDWTALDIIAWIGGLTALLAALIALQQNDIKRILAYSTLSQLGYMIMTVGCGAPASAMYHLSTHAFFKALLFLGAGAVIHALHQQQDIWQMGDLRRRMPVTYWTFLIATLALCGVPPTSGFYSKDAVLSAAAHHSALLFVLGTLVAVLTTLYMFRLVFVAFLGPAKSAHVEHAHEAPPVMKWPLIALAIPSVLAGLWGIHGYFEAQFEPGAAEHARSWIEALFAPIGHSPLAAMAGLGAIAFGFSFAWTLYYNTSTDPLPQRLGGLAQAMRDRFYFDEIYNGLIAITHEALSHLAAWFDRWIIAGFFVRGTHATVELMGRTLRLIQTGNLQSYAWWFATGVLILLVVLWRQLT